MGRINRILVITFLLQISFSSQIVFAQDLQEKNKLVDLEKQVKQSEQEVEGLKPDNEARILWNPENPYEQSDIVFLYLHGFGASNREGEPVMSLLSKRYHANVYMSRLKEHGINRDNSMEYLTEENYIQSAEDALIIARKLGKHVVIVSTSTGGTLGLILASRHSDIEGLVLYSPFIDLFDPAGHVITKSYGKLLFWFKNFSMVADEPRNGEVAKYWSNRYHVNGYIALMSMIDDYMKDVTFSKVKCPVFLGYYYKNEEEQDHTVSVKAMKHMYESLGTDNSLKVSCAFPFAGNHVIACDLRSNDWQAVFNRTREFMDTILLPKMKEDVEIRDEF